MKNIIITILAITFIGSCLNLKFLSLPDEKEELLNQLKGYSRENLELIALAGDDYWRTKLPKEILILRGLREYIHSLNEAQIRNIIVEQVKTYEGLTLEKLLNLSGMQKTQKYDSLHDYLKTIDKQNLIIIALRAEKFARDKKDIKDVLGGLEDYINNLSDLEIRNIIIGFSKTYPELLSNGVLSEDFSKKLLTHEEMKVKLSEYKRYQLVHLSVSLEQYEREKTHIHRLGGLHDYAYSLKFEELVNVCMNIIIRNAELCFEGKLDSILNRYLSDPNPILGGIEDYLRDFFRPELEKMALALEKKRNKIEGTEGLIGGLHDYIFKLSDDQVISIISNHLVVFPEVRKAGDLEELSGVVKYGLRSVISQKDIKIIQKYCLGLEKYESEKTGRPLGKLSERIDSMTVEDLLSYISKKVKTFPETCTEEELDKLSKKLL